MKLYNIRKGFCCNSSSTHSIILADEEQQDIPESNLFVFGWENFILASEEAKMRYLLSIIYYNFDEEEQLGEDYKIKHIDILKEIFQEDYMQKYFDKNDNEHYIFRQYCSPSVDHQSFIALPIEQYTGKFNMNYIKELKEELKKPKITICGGNDNDDTSDNRPYGKPLWLLSSTNKALFVVKDELSNSWIAIDREKGDRFIFTFDESSKVINKSSFPLSVDLKITNYCTKNCYFCYQNSSKDGIHAPYNIIKNWIDLLVELKVMEVTFGGGEPTTHPDFLKIIEYAKSKNIIQSFTTSNLAWFSETPIQDIKKVMQQINAFAFTPTTENDITTILAFIRFYGINIPIYFNLVENLHRSSFSGYDGFIERAKHHYWDYTKNIIINFLGFKDTNEKTKTLGKFKPNKKEIIKALIKAETLHIPIGVDTAFANKYQDILDILGVNPKLYFKEEGKFSMYIDAVEGKLGKSSYTDEYIEFKPNKQNIEKFLNIYRSF